jgi:hypothetical protein
MNDLTKKENVGDITVVLDKLSSLLEEAITIQKQNREMAIKNYEYFSNTLKSTHTEIETISESGVLEKETNKALSLLIESAKTLEKPIEVLSKILSTRMNADALKSIGNVTVTTPIDIDAFR